MLQDFAAVSAPLVEELGGAGGEVGVGRPRRVVRAQRHRPVGHAGSVTEKGYLSYRWSS